MDEQQKPKRFCTQCGAELNAGAGFCSKCGAPVGGVPAAQTPAPENPNVRAAKEAVQSAFGAAGQRINASRNLGSPFIRMIKKLILSPLGIIGAIAFSLMLLLSINNSGSSFTAILQAIPDAEDLFGALGSAGESVLSTLRSGARVVTLLFSLPDIVIAIGIWMTLYAAFEQRETISSAGLRTVRVVNTILLVLDVLWAIVWLILIGAASANRHAIGALLIFVYALVLAPCIFRIYCRAQGNQLLTRLYYAIEAQHPVSISPFMGIMCFISGGAYAFQALAGEGGMALAAWCGAIAYICFGAWIMKYRRAIEYDTAAITADASAESAEVSAASDATDGAYAVQGGYDPTAEDTHMYSDADGDAAATSVGMRKKAIAFAGVAIAAILLISFLFSGGNVDKRIIGKWRFNSNSDAVVEFRRGGAYVANAGTSDEERGTYRTEDGTIYVTIDGEESGLNYRVVDDENIQIERKYWTGSYWGTRWVSLWRVD